MPKPKSPNLEDAFDIFMLDNRASGFTDSTLTFYRTQLTPFLAWCQAQGALRLDALTPAIIRAYLVHRQEQGLADHTVHAAARSIKALCNFCVKEGLISESPMAKVSMPKLPKLEMPTFTPEDARKLINACDNERDAAIVMVLLDTGIRSSELTNLRGGDIDAKTGSIFIRQGKGQKDRTVYAGAKTLRQLRRYYLERGTPGPDDPIWLSLRGGEPLKTSGLRQLLERIGRQAGVKHSNPHTYRRTFALLSLRNGMSIYHLQRLMGHEDITVLRSYLALVQDDLKDAHEQYGAVDSFL